MKIYVVDKKDYMEYRQPELEKMSREVTKVTDEQVIIEVKFSENGRDFSAVDTLLYQLLIRQYESKRYIKQNDLNKIEESISKIEKRDIETLNSTIFAKCVNIKDVNDIVEIINNRKNYMLLYMTDLKDLGEFIVGNIEEYKIPIRILNKIEYYINYKGIAEEYLYDNYLEIIQTKDLLLDISKNKDDELVKKLQMKKVDARTIYDIKERNTNKNFEEVKNLKIENEEEME